MLSFVLAGLAGVLIFFADGPWQIFLPLAALAVFLSGFFDALDGKVAKMTGKASRRGDYVDHVLDRYSDVLMVGAIAVSAWCNTVLGLLALVGVLLTSYMGTQAQAVGVGRNYGGLLGRADRIVLLIAAPLAQYALMANGMVRFEIASYNISAFEVVMIWFAVVGNLTAAQRAVKGYRLLK